MSNSVFTGRRVVLGVCGGIAAYKTVELCRRLVDSGAHVSVIMTEDSHRFIGPVTFSALSSEPVHTSLWEDASPIPHTSLGRSADLVIVAPATARMISAYATGYAHDLLSNTLIATRAPVVVCPAMHTEMWDHPAVQHNIRILSSRGVVIVEPESGRLAGGDVGTGRLASIERVLDAAAASIAGRGGVRDMEGTTVLVTAGGTREPIDAVRVIANRSSGKQGHAIANEASARGARVTLVTTADREVAEGVSVIRVETAEQMLRAVQGEFPGVDVAVMSAAVADFRPVSAPTEKIKKSDGVPEINLERTTDILKWMGSAKSPRQVLVGFAAETSDLEEHATGKLRDKKLDMIVANDVARAGAGFGHDTNEVLILDRTGGKKMVDLMDKRLVARAVLDSVVELLKTRRDCS